MDNDDVELVKNGMFRGIPINKVESVKKEMKKKLPIYTVINLIISLILGTIIDSGLILFFVYSLIH